MTGRGVTRRKALKLLGAAGALGLAPIDAGEDRSSPGERVGPAQGFRSELEEKVFRTPIADTHEHLPDEEERLRGERIDCDDWAVLFGHYLESDLASAGMPASDQGRFQARGVDPIEKWRLLEPWWPAVKNTGYGRAVRIAVQALYGIDEVEAAAVPRLAAAYEAARRPGLYRRVLVDLAGIDHCQVNYLWSPFRESSQPAYLFQDISILGMHMGPDIEGLARPAGKDVKDLSGWHAVIDWWFEKYGSCAVAVKSQAAYGRGLDFERVPAERAEPVFRKVLGGEPVAPEEKKLLEDHLFWYAVERATSHGLPVKLHTGYYAGQNSMPLGRVAANAAQAADLCRRAPASSFVFMHIAYPFWQDLLAVAKHYTNAHIDMCWSWIIDPASAKEFLKAYLVTAPSNKLLTFGGDYIPVECVLGHARIARAGIARALSELVEEGLLSRRDALDLVEPLLRGNARRIFRVDKREAALRSAPWAAAGRRL